MDYPKHIQSVVFNAKDEDGLGIDKINPATEEFLSRVVSASPSLISNAVTVARASNWRDVPLFERARILRSATELLLLNKNEIAKLLAVETGRSLQSAEKEVEAASLCGSYLSDHAQSLEDEDMDSAVKGRSLKLTHAPLGVGVLITPYNNPLAGIAWKIFPALLAGNTVVVKAHELAPFAPIQMGRYLIEAGVPESAVQVLEGGAEVGKSIITNEHISFVSFTGSSNVAQHILTTTAPRLTRVSVESGGKNPFVVCDDANLERAATLAVRSSFIDAGQRCAAASRIIVTEGVFEEFKKLFLGKVAKLSVGTEDVDDYGAIISGTRLDDILTDVQRAQDAGARLLFGGHRMKRSGYFMEPTVLDEVGPSAVLSQKEIFGPVAVLYKVKNLSEAIALANNARYFLASAIHTQSKENARLFEQSYRGGVVRVNGPTFGSEPHVPFGGEGLSGNGWREPGIAALSFYSNLKQVSYDI